MTRPSKEEDDVKIIEPYEIQFKANMVPGVTMIQLTVGTGKPFRAKELVVKTTDDFNVGLFFGSDMLVNHVPAMMFSEAAAPETRQLPGKIAYPFPATDIVLVIENESDAPQDFAATLKGSVIEWTK